MRSRIEAASSIALSTKYPFAMFGLFGAMSISLRAAKIVAANRMANFLPQSHGTPAWWSEIQAREAGTAVYFFPSHKSMKSFTVDLKTAWLENQARVLFSAHSAYAIQYSGNVGA